MYQRFSHTFLCFRGSASVYWSETMFSTWLSVRPLPNLKANEPILLQTGVSGPRGKGMKHQLLGSGGQKVKDQGHTTRNLDLKTWRRHHSRPFGE